MNRIPLPLSENRHLAQHLREAAELLAAQQANPFRVGAYLKAADHVAQMQIPVREIFNQQGIKGLEALPHIGHSIAAAIVEMLITGRWNQLQRLRGTLDPELFTSIPDVGPELAEQIHDALGVDTLEALEIACHDGRLAQVPGVGERRAAEIRNAVTAMLNHAHPHAPRISPEDLEEPPVGLLLRVDRDYRRKAQANELPKIAPRRFNPKGERWLPILHETLDHWHLTALYSNTATAHKLGRMFDWVVLLFHHDGQAEHQRTVVTETRGPLRGQRVVRGRERECDAWYADQSARQL